jgi:hypothetical protein
MAAPQIAAKVNSEYAPLIKDLGFYASVKTIQDLLAEVSDYRPTIHATKEKLLSQVEFFVSSRMLPITRVRETVSEYQFAGKVSVCFGIPLEYRGFTKTQLEKLLCANRNTNPFEYEIKPELTQKPSFNRAEWMSDTKLRLEFTYAGKSYELEDDYQLRTIKPTNRVNAYIRLLDKVFLVETRASIRETKLIHDAISRLLGVEVTAMNFSDQDFALLKYELKAKLRKATSKSSGGQLDIISVSASPEIDDLEDSEEFKQKFNNGEFRAKRLEFPYIQKSGFTMNVSLYVSHQGNIWFMSDVSEAIIEYVLSAVRTVKFLPPINKLRQSGKSIPDVDSQIEVLLNAIRSNGYAKRFSPRIYQTLGLKVDEKSWIETISKLVQLGFLTENYELCCPFCHETISIYQSYKHLPLDQEISCGSCGHTFVVSEQDIFLTYTFKEDLITHSSNSMVESLPVSPMEKCLLK